MSSEKSNIMGNFKYSLKETKDNCITSLEELKKYINLSSDETKLNDIVDHFPMRVTKYYLSLIDKNDPDDPILKMVVPSVEELSMKGSFDASDEKSNTKRVGLQHKYSQTALILTTNRCLSYCRFCFRKRLVGLTEKEVVHNIDEAYDYIVQHEEITNVLLSGGDPLSLDNHIIEHLLESFYSIDHVRFVRFGSRTPVVYPHRFFDNDLIDLFKKYSSPTKRIHLVTHFNHPNEITPESIEAIRRILDAGVVMHNQTVLLKGVNDDPDVLSDLFLTLNSMGITPYYLFQCRPVCKVTHFQVPIETALGIVKHTRKQLDGLSKRFRFVMSHADGKVEVVGKDETYTYFRFHQAKEPSNIGKFFKYPCNSEAYWLDDYKK